MAEFRTSVCIERLLSNLSNFKLERVILDDVGILLKPDTTISRSESSGRLFGAMLSTLGCEYSSYFRSLCGRLCWKLVLLYNEPAILELCDAQSAQTITNILSNRCPSLSHFASLPLVVGFCAQTNVCPNVCYLLDLVGILTNHCCLLPYTDPHLALSALRELIILFKRSVDAEKQLDSRAFDLLNGVRAVIHCHWESRFAAVTDLIVDLTENLLLLLDVGFIDWSVTDWIDYYLNVPWFVKGKYRILPLLMKRCPRDYLLEIGDELKSQLFNCQRIQHTATVTCPTVVQWIIRLSGRHQVVIDLLAQCLTSESSLQRITVARYWLASLLRNTEGRQMLQELLEQLQSQIEIIDASKCWPLTWSEVRMLNCINDSEAELSDWTLEERRVWALTTIARLWTHKCSAQELPDLDQIIDRCLGQRQSEIRIEAFQIIVKNLCKTWDQVNLNRMVDFVLENLAVDDFSFRERMIKTLDDLLRFVCARKHAAKCRSNAEIVRNALDRLLQGVFSNLLPGINYQRTVAVLQIVHSICCNVAENELLKPLLHHLSETANLRLLLYQLQSTSAFDVRRLGAKIIRNFADLEIDGFDVRGELLDLVRDLSNSPKELDCDAAYDILELMFDCQIVNMEQMYDSLITQAQDSFQNIKSNLFEAAQKQPLHGIFKIMALIVRRFSDSKVQIPYEKLHMLVDLALDTVNFTLTAVGSSSKGDCPSFAEMERNLGSLADLEEDLLPQDYQLILALSWLCIKDSANLLNRLAVNCLLAENSNGVKFWTDLCDCYVQILTRIRHKGALDHCASSFSEFCQLCKNNDQQEISTIPSKLLTETLSLISDPAQISTRDVGFCAILEAVLIAENTLPQKRAFCNSVESLLACTDSPGCSSDQTVRIIKCITFLVKNARWALAVLPFLDRCFVLAVDNFRAPDWPSRSAASQLISAIYYRIFGRREVCADVCFGSTMTLSEFVSLFEPVWHRCCSMLHHSLQQNHLTDPAIYLLMSFVQNLILVHPNFQSDRINRSLEQLRADLLQLSERQPDFRLRKSAKVSLNRLNGHFEEGQLDGKFGNDSKTETVSGRLKALYGYCEPLKQDAFQFLVCAAFEQQWGASAQCLALPVLTNNLILLDQHNLLRSWLCCVEANANDSLMETRRLSAAHAICIFYHKRKTVELSPNARFRLFLCVLKLLYDEISEVRMVLCKISGILTGNDALNREQTLKLVLNDVCNDHQMSLLLLTHTVARFSNVCRETKSSENRYLFEDRDFNVYEEEAIVDVQLRNACIEILERHEHITHEHFDHLDETEAEQFRVIERTNRSIVRPEDSVRICHLRRKYLHVCNKFMPRNL